jgi:hypothetical protein
MARIPRYSTFNKKSDLKVFRKKIVICEMKTAAQKPEKDACSLSFLPVIISEREIVKLVAARINVSIINKKDD